jgi:hypothetical protein
MTDHCARCGLKVKTKENWMRVHLWASIAVFHYRCFIALLKSEGTASAEEATFQVDGHANK